MLVVLTYTHTYLRKMSKFVRKLVLFLFVIVPTLIVIKQISQQQPNPVKKSGISSIDCKLSVNDSHKLSTTKLSDSVYFFLKDSNILEQVDKNDEIQAHFLARKRMLQKRYESYDKTNLPVKEVTRPGGDLISIVSADGEFFWSHLVRFSNTI